MSIPDSTVRNVDFVWDEVVCDAEAAIHWFLTTTRSLVLRSLSTKKPAHGQRHSISLRNASVGWTVEQER